MLPEDEYHVILTCSVLIRFSFVLVHVRTAVVQFCDPLDVIN